MKDKKHIPGSYYHIYNRGNSKQKIFLDKEDYERFLNLLFLCNSKKRFKLKDIFNSQDKRIYSYEKEKNLVNVCAYVLMPNHYHIMISLPSGSTGGEVSDYMKKISVGYSAYFNFKYNRTGSLFEGRYKSTIVDNDEYLKYLFAYIHLNPVKLVQSDWKDVGIKNIAKAKEFLSKFNYSSLRDWVGHEREQSVILHKESLFKIIDKSIDLEKEIYFWLNYTPVQPE